MHRTHFLLCLLIVLLSICIPSRITQADSPAPLQWATVAAPAVEGYSAGVCSVTPTAKAEPPKDPNADPFGFGDWYINADRTIWVPGISWQAGRGEKVIWIRPVGTQLEVRGRRLDGKAPPLKINIPGGYPTGFQSTGMTFPTEGCWEITAKAGRNELRIVTKVASAKKISANRNK